jgi:hypothetical protein
MSLSWGILIKPHLRLNFVCLPAWFTDRLPDILWNLPWNYLSQLHICSMCFSVPHVLWSQLQVLGCFCQPSTAFTISLGLNRIPLCGYSNSNSYSSARCVQTREIKKIITGGIKKRTVFSSMMVSLMQIYTCTGILYCLNCFIRYYEKFSDRTSENVWASSFIAW